MFRGGKHFTFPAEIHIFTGCSENIPDVCACCGAVTCCWTPVFDDLHPALPAMIHLFRIVSGKSCDCTGQQKRDQKNFFHVMTFFFGYLFPIRITRFFCLSSKKYDQKKYSVAYPSDIKKTIQKQCAAGHAMLQSKFLPVDYQGSMNFSILRCVAFPQVFTKGYSAVELSPSIQELPRNPCHLPYFS